MENKHIIYFDTLRTIAIFAVVLLHVAATHINEDVNSVIWNISLFWNSLSRWGVPIFIMISGALFLNPSKVLSISTVYTKYIKRIFILLICWSCIYTLYRLIAGQIDFNIIKISSSIINGYYHLWFLYMIIGLYAITPLIKKIIETKTYTQYFIVLSILFSFTIPTIYCISDSITLLSGNEKITIFFHSFFERFNFNFTIGYIAYYIIGYYVASTNISSRARYSIYFLGIISFCFTYFYSLFISVKIGSSWNIFNNMSLNVLFESLSIFLFFKDFLNKEIVGINVLNKLGKYSLGIYLVHAMILDAIKNQYWFNSLYENSFLSIPLIAILIYLFSLICIFIISKIPIIKNIIS